MGRLGIGPDAHPAPARYRAGMPPTEERLETLTHPGDPSRLVRVRVERPAGEDAPLPAVLILHGFKGFMHWGFFPELSRDLAEAGFVAVSLNASGSGVGEDLETFTEHEAFARNTYSAELEDLELVREHAASLPEVDADRLALLGHSRGGGVALLHAARRGDYRAVVTWSSIEDVDRMDEATKTEWRERGHIWIPNARTGQQHRLDLDALRDAERNREALDVLAACRRIEAPVLVVHGTEDPAVGFEASRRLIEALPNAAHVPVEGAGHTFGATHPFAGRTPELEIALEATRAFLIEHV